MPEVSVVLATCDRPKLLVRALQSALRQTGADFEVIVVDSNHDCPPVAENELVAEMLADPRVVLVCPEPRPFSCASARNAGLGAAQGQWICYLDDDDEFLPGRLQRQLDLAHRSGSPLVICGYTFVWPSGRRRIRQCAQTEFSGDALLGDAQLISAALFHRADPAWRFDELLYSGEDRVAAIEFLVRHHVEVVPCVTQPGSLVYSQKVSAHKNMNRAWEGCLAGLRSARRAGFSSAARRKFLLAGSIERAVAGHGSFGRLLGLLAEWRRLAGWGSFRFLVYALSTRLGG